MRIKSRKSKGYVVSTDMAYGNMQTWLYLWAKQGLFLRTYPCPGAAGIDTYHLIR